MTWCAQCRGHITSSMFDGPTAAHTFGCRLLHAQEAIDRQVAHAAKGSTAAVLTTSRHNRRLQGESHKSPAHSGRPSRAPAANQPRGMYCSRQTINDAAITRPHLGLAGVAGYRLPAAVGSSGCVSAASLPPPAHAGWCAQSAWTPARHMGHPMALSIPERGI